MALNLTWYKTTCDTCGSKIDRGKKDIHRHYWERNYDNDSVNLRLHHQAHNKKLGDMCFCGGCNPDCKRCGGSGRIL